MCVFLYLAEKNKQKQQKNEKRTEKLHTSVLFCIANVYCLCQCVENAAGYTRSIFAIDSCYFVAG